MCFRVIMRNILIYLHIFTYYSQPTCIRSSAPRSRDGKRLAFSLASFSKFALVHIEWRRARDRDLQVDEFFTQAVALLHSALHHKNKFSTFNYQSG